MCSLSPTNLHRHAAAVNEITTASNCQELKSRLKLTLPDKFTGKDICNFLIDISCTPRVKGSNLGKLLNNLLQLYQKTDSSKNDVNAMLKHCSEEPNLNILRECLSTFPVQFDRDLNPPLFRLIQKATAMHEARLVSALKGTKLKDFHIVRRLGKDAKLKGRGGQYEGAQSIVFAVKLKKRPELGEFALKFCLSELDESADLYDQFHSDLLARADKSPRRLPSHPNIIPVLHTFTDASKSLRDVSVSTRQLLEVYGGAICLCNSLFIISKAWPSSLQRRMQIPETYDRSHERRCLVFTKQLLRAVRHLNQHRIVHRDIKPDNILVSPQALALVDLGEALDCAEDDLDQFFFPYETRDRKLGGAPQNLPPEILVPRPHKGLKLNYVKTDVWAVGLVLYKMLAGDEAPYKCAGGKKHSRVISKDWLLNDPQWQILPACYTKETQRLCQGLLQIDLASRFDIDTAIKSVDAAIEAASQQTVSVCHDQVDMYLIVLDCCWLPSIFLDFTNAFVVIVLSSL